MELINRYPMLWGETPWIFRSKQVCCLLSIDYGYCFIDVGITTSWLWHGCAWVVCRHTSVLHGHCEHIWTGDKQGSILGGIWIHYVLSFVSVNSKKWPMIFPRLSVHLFPTIPFSSYFFWISNTWKYAAALVIKT